MAHGTNQKTLSFSADTVRVAEYVECATANNLTLGKFLRTAADEYAKALKAAAEAAPKVIPVRPPVTGPRSNATAGKCNITDAEFALLGVTRDEYDSRIQYDMDEVIEFTGHLYWIRGHAPASEDFLPNVRYDGDTQYLDWAEYYYSEVEPRPSVMPMFKRIRVHLDTLEN